MSDTHILRTRLPVATQKVVEAIARQQQLTVSAWIRRLIETALQSTSVPTDPLMSRSDSSGSVRRARLTIRLEAEDRRWLESRAINRAMPAATYASALLRAHLRHAAPVPKAELQALRQAVGELGAIGRNLNQLARLANAGERGAVSRDELRSLLRACQGLRHHVLQLLSANLRSWEIGNAETDG